MSIADKIQRLQAAKAAIAAAIAGKGGSVAAGDGFEDFAADVASIPSGITPTGNINITDTQQTDVTNYATAQVVDADLVAGNIKKDVDILGVVGTFEGGGGSSTFYVEEVTVASDVTTVKYSTFENAISTALGNNIISFSIKDAYTVGGIFAGGVGAFFDGDFRPPGIPASSGGGVAVTGTSKWGIVSTNNYTTYTFPAGATYIVTRYRS